MKFSYVPVFDGSKLVAHDLFHEQPDGRFKPMFRFDGIYGDVRDLDVLARIAALPSMIEAAKSATFMIGSIQEEFQETGSGNAVLWRLKTANRRATEIVDTNFWSFGPVDEEDRFETFHELDAAALELTETTAMAARQIEYLGGKFGARDWEGAVAAADKAVAKAERIEPWFESEEFRNQYEEWRASSSAALEAARAKFRR